MTGGYLISVESVEQVGERVIVRYNEISPGEDDIVTLAITYPWIVLKVQSDLPIDVVTPDASLGNASSGRLLTIETAPTEESALSLRMLPRLCYSFRKYGLFRPKFAPSNHRFS